MVIHELSIDEMLEDLRKRDRDYFSYNALEYFCELLESCGTTWEWDPVALCCEWTEESYLDIIDNYNIDVSEAEDEDEKISIVWDYLNYHSIGAETSHGIFMYQTF